MGLWASIIVKTLGSPTALGYTLGAGGAHDQRSEADSVPDRSFRVSVKSQAQEYCLKSLGLMGLWAKYPHTEFQLSKARV